MVVEAVKKVLYPAGRLLARFTKTGVVKVTDSQFWKDKERALGFATVGSIVAKDGIGCLMYVTQSMHNKKIPDERRKFVVSLDATNGILMIVAQILMFLAMRRYSGDVFNFIFKKSFNEKARQQLLGRLRMLSKKGIAWAKKHNMELPEVMRTVFSNKGFKEVRKDALDAFKFVLDTGAATIVGKRVIVPLIATPLAAKLEKWMNKKEAEKLAKEGKLPSVDTVAKEPAKEETASEVSKDSDTNKPEVIGNFIDFFSKRAKAEQQQSTAV